MFNYYLKTIFRNLNKFKTISIINVAGLAIGMTICILILLYIHDEFSYDTFHEKGDNIYRIVSKHPFTAPQLAKLLKDNFPEVKESTRILINDKVNIKYHEKQYNETEFAMVDPGFFKIFSFNLKRGDPETALKKPFSIVISEKATKKYFNNEDPIGKMLKIDTKQNFTVTGIFEDMPHNSHFHFSLLASLADEQKLFGELANNWGWENFITYLLFDKKISTPAFAKKSSALIAEHRKRRPDEKPVNYSLQPLKDIHLYSAYMENDISPQGNITYIFILSAISLLILLIACANYINLLTANASARMNEVGIKKTVGATGKQLTRQFILESAVIVLIALVFSLILVELSRPAFNYLTEKNFTASSMINGTIILGIVGIVFFTGLVSGIYPATILSSQQPAKIIQSSRNSKKSSPLLRKTLVGFQFTISITLIIVIMLMLGQLNFLRNKPLGFKKDNVIIAEVENFSDISKFHSLKNTLLQNPAVTMVSSASRIPSDTWTNYGGFMPEGQSKSITMPIGHINFDYFKILDIKPIQGRLFSEKYAADADEAIILNESAVKKLGISQSPLDTSITITWPKSRRKVIGVVKDFHLESMHNEINPTAFVISPAETWKLMVKINSTANSKIINQIVDSCKTVYPEWVFEFRFLDDRIEALYSKERKTFSIMEYFTFIAILLAGLGIYGLASFSTSRRLKEVGIRRIHGASKFSISILLSKEFIRGVIIAFIIACPIAYYAISRWLEKFVYRTEISWLTFAVSGLIALATALLAVSWHTFRAARINPVKTLHHE